MKQRWVRSERFFVYRSLAYLALLILLLVLSRGILFEGVSQELSKILAVVVFLSLGQLVASFLPLKGSSWTFGFFVADAGLAMLLVRFTGGSGSPFLVLFPLLTLAGAVAFKPVWTAAYGTCILFFLYFAMGSTLSIAGNALAVIVTGFLGSYLVRALTKSGAELEQSETQRRKLESLQKAILANIPSGLMSIDPEGRIIQINSVASRILGRDDKDLLYRSVREVLPSLDADRMKLSTELPQLASNDMPMHDDGQDRPTVAFQKGSELLQLGYSIARLTDPAQGRVMGSLLVFQDLTNILKLEESLRVSEKLAAVGKLAGSIAHEIRNPLASISGSAQLLGQIESLGLEDKKLLSIIQKESSRLDELISEFLEYVRPQAPKEDTVELPKLLDELKSSLDVNAKWQALKASIEIVVLPGASLRVLGDANKITQVLLNLVFNAGQAGATIVRMRVEPQLRLSVSDNGAGISSENQKRLFEPFFTTKERGTGLGLATSYRVLDAMGARVTVTSPSSEFQLGRGTIFRITFKGVE